MTWKKYITFVLILSLFLSLVSCTNLKIEKSELLEEKNILVVQTKANIVYSYYHQNCDEMKNIYDNEEIGKPYLIWNNNTLVVELFLLLDCKDEVTGADFEIEDELITLISYISKKKLSDGCNCVHKISYSFKNILAKDYNFKILPVFEESSEE
jgi:hypothetical protein